jgi:hypothetical protein
MGFEAALKEAFENIKSRFKNNYQNTTKHIEKDSFKGI